MRYASPARYLPALVTVLLAACLVAAILFLPAWAVTLVAILYLAEGGPVFLVLLAGGALDAAYAAGSHHSFAIIFAVLAFAALYLRTRLLE
jgi:hypothetical protein